MPDFFPLQLLLATFAGWVNREQAPVVAYLVEDGEQLGERRLPCNPKSSIALKQLYLRRPSIRRIIGRDASLLPAST